MCAFRKQYSTLDIHVLCVNSVNIGAMPLAERVSQGTDMMDDDYTRASRFLSKYSMYHVCVVTQTARRAGDTNTGEGSGRDHTSYVSFVVSASEERIPVSTLYRFEKNLPHSNL